MHTSQLLTTAVVMSSVALCEAALAQADVWRLYNDKSETWRILVKPAGDPDHLGKWYEIASKKHRNIALPFPGEYFLEGEPAGKGSYHRLTVSLNLRETPFNKIGDIFTPKKDRRGTTLRNRRGAIVYEAMEANGFEEDEYYSNLVGTLSRSTWQSTYTTSNNNNVPMTIQFDGNQAKIGTGKLSGVLYTPSDFEGKIIVAGNWSHGSKRGRFVFRFDENLGRFNGRWRFHDGNTWRSWNGTRRQ